MRLSKSPITYWIFDRYAYDLIVDPLRFRVQIPAGLIKMMLRVVPKPSLIFCLGGDPVTIYNRKPETSLAEVERQIESLRFICNASENAVWIDTTMAIGQCRDQILKAMMENL